MAVCNQYENAYSPAYYPGGQLVLGLRVREDNLRGPSYETSPVYVRTRIGTRSSRIPWRACANSAYQALFLLPLLRAWERGYKSVCRSSENCLHPYRSHSVSGWIKNVSACARIRTSITISPGLPHAIILCTVFQWNRLLRGCYSWLLV